MRPASWYSRIDLIGIPVRRESSPTVISRGSAPLMVTGSILVSWPMETCGALMTPPLPDHLQAGRMGDAAEHVAAGEQRRVPDRAGARETTVTPVRIGPWLQLGLHGTSAVLFRSFIA